MVDVDTQFSKNRSYVFGTILKIRIDTNCIGRKNIILFCNILLSDTLSFK